MAHNDETKVSELLNKNDICYSALRWIEYL